MRNRRLVRTRWIFPMALLLLASMLATACGSKEANSGGHESNKVTRLPNGDLQEITASTDQLPAFLDGKHEVIVHAYQTAAANMELLDWIPCYCGCGEVAGHSNNKNCFIKEVREDGSVVWDDHGTRCNVCIEIAEVSAQMKEQGMTDKDIRQVIDKAYQEGYAQPTKTSMPD